MRFGTRVSAGRSEVSSSWRTGLARSVLSVSVPNPPGLLRTMVSRSWNWNTPKSYSVAWTCSQWAFDEEPWPLRKGCSHSWGRPIVAYPGNELRMELAERIRLVPIGVGIRREPWFAESITYFKKPETAR